MIWSEQNVCSSRRKVEELEDDHHYENEIDKKLDERNLKTINSNLKGLQL